MAGDCEDEKNKDAREREVEDGEDDQRARARVDVAIQKGKHCQEEGERVRLVGQQRLVREEDRVAEQKRKQGGRDLVGDGGRNGQDKGNCHAPEPQERLTNPKPRTVPRHQKVKPTQGTGTGLEKRDVPKHNQDGQGRHDQDTNGNVGQDPDVGL